MNITKNIVIQDDRKNDLEQGLIVEAFDLVAFEQIKVYKEEGKIYKLRTNTRNREYESVELHTLKPDILRLTASETLQGIKACMEAKRGVEIIVHRKTLGLKDDSGNNLTREQQKSLDLDAKIRVRFSLKEGYTAYTLNSKTYQAFICYDREGDLIA